MLPLKKTTLLSLDSDWSLLIPRSGNGLDIKQARFIKPVHQNISAEHEGGRWGQPKSCFSSVNAPA
jgi:hypothetical protein